jgi:hypothetical protein
LLVVQFDILLLEEEADDAILEQHQLLDVEKSEEECVQHLVDEGENID